VLVDFSDFFTTYEEISKIPGPVYDQSKEKIVEKENLTTLEKIAAYFNMINPSIWIFLALVGFLTALV